MSKLHLPLCVENTPDSTGHHNYKLYMQFRHTVRSLSHVRQLGVLISLLQ